MNTRLLIMVFLWIAILSACSTDPCQDLNCVNGSCVEGTCECLEGWEGADCSVMKYNLIGEFESSGVELANCPSAGTAQAVDGEICSPSTGDRSCLRYLLKIRDDATWQITLIEITYTGNIVRRDPTIFTGTHTINLNTATLCEEGGTDCFEVVQFDNVDELRLRWPGLLNDCMLYLDFVRQ